MANPDRTDAQPRTDVDLGAGEATGRYRILGVLGEGAYGRVLKARDRELDREVAIKVLTQAARSPVATERFLREARLTSAIDHPHIVQVYDYGLDGKRLPFLVYEFVAGDDLRRRVARGCAQADLLRWGVEVCGALQAVHDAGAIHRDVKPANVLVTADDRALLADFGLARLELDSQALTQTGALVGTPAYLGPEIWGGRLATPASDQWSWAASLFALLYGQNPYGTSELPELMARAAELTAPEVPEEHRGRAPQLEKVLRRALRALPEGRFPDMAAFGAALAACVDGTSRALVLEPRGDVPRGADASTRTVGHAPLATPTPAASPPRVRGLALVGLAALAGVLLWAGRGSPPPGPVATAPDSEEVEAAARRLLPNHDLGDGSKQGYEAHLAAIRKTFGDPRISLRFRRLLLAATAWDEAAQAVEGPRARWADALLEEHLHPTLDHLALDLGMIRELRNSQSLTGPLGEAGRGASQEELASLEERSGEFVAAIQELLPGMGTLVAPDRPASLALRTRLSGFFDLDTREDLLAEVLRLQAAVEDRPARAQLLLAGLHSLPGIFGLKAGDCAPRRELLEASLEALRWPADTLEPERWVRLAGRAISQYQPFLSRCDADPDGLVTELYEAAAAVFERDGARSPGPARTYLQWFVLTDSVILGRPEPAHPERWRAVTRRLRRTHDELAHRAREGTPVGASESQDPEAP